MSTEEVRTRPAILKEQSGGPLIFNSESPKVRWDSLASMPIVAYYAVL